MLPKKNRLQKKEDFQNVYLKGKFFSLDNIIIKFAKNSQPESRIGFAVGKNYSKLAVQRNKIRRALSSLLYPRINELTPGFDIIFMIKKTKPEPKREALMISLEKILKKNNLLK
ncbi:MAG: hypothetical protein ACD_11C00116G0012 [uncultured bacterium]|nr:MAG: hypothetical protein ACD_11C00116G0012 [uncultured bacterium]HBR71243.1 ribonuclease P protein component [Candidatus Moranbacteria bacterium]